MEDLRLEKGETSEIYSHRNATGTIRIKILADGDPETAGKAKIWWTKGPFGTNKHLGVLEGSNVLKIEGWLWGRLKATATESDVLITLEETPTPRIKFSFPWS